MLLSALILGLLGSLHCVGMCGPIAFMLPVDRNNKAKKLGQIAIYHVGRLSAYALIGLLFGLLGKGLSIFGLQQKLSILIGVVMVGVILLPFGKLKKYNLAKPLYQLIAKVKSQLGKELSKRTADTFLTIGFLNGFLPCGLVYMAVLGAIAMGHPGEGALYMALFGLGTVPLMTSAIYFSGLLKGVAKQRFQRLIPVFVVAIGLLFILRGLGLGIPYLSPKPVMEVAVGTMECVP